MESVITDLKVQSRNRNRLNIYLDGAYRFGLSRSLAEELRVGQVLSDERIRELKRRDVEEVNYQRAARLISRRPRSEYELRQNFSRRGVQSEVQEAVLARLREASLVDDQAFADTWVENRRVFRPRSAFALKEELRRKGVSKEAIEAALDGYDDDQAAYQAAQKAARRWRGTPWELFEQRVGAYLRRRGFTYSTISPVVLRVWREITGEEHESEGFK